MVVCATFGGPDSNSCPTERSPQFFLVSLSMTFITPNSALAFVYHFNSLPCSGTRRGRSGSGPLPPVTTEEPMESSSFMTSQTRQVHPMYVYFMPVHTYTIHFHSCLYLNAPILCVTLPYIHSLSSGVVYEC